MHINEMTSVKNMHRHIQNTSNIDRFERPSEKKAKTPAQNMGVCKIRFWETVMLVFKEDVFTHARSTSAILVGGDFAVFCGLCGSRYKSNWSVFKELPTSESDSEKL